MSASFRGLHTQVCDHQALLPLLSPGYFIHSINSGHTMYQALRITISQLPVFWGAGCKAGVLAARLGCRLQGWGTGCKAGGVG